MGTATDTGANNAAADAGAGEKADAAHGADDELDNAGNSSGQCLA